MSQGNSVAIGLLLGKISNELNKHTWKVMHEKINPTRESNVWWISVFGSDSDFNSHWFGNDDRSSSVSHRIIAIHVDLYLLSHNMWKNKLHCSSMNLLIASINALIIIFQFYTWTDCWDLNPVDYKIWECMQEMVYNTKVRDVEDLRKRTVQAWNDLD